MKWSTLRKSDVHFYVKILSVSVFLFCHDFEQDDPSTILSKRSSEQFGGKCMRELIGDKLSKFANM